MYSGSSSAPPPHAALVSTGLSHSMKLSARSLACLRLWDSFESNLGLLIPPAAKRHLDKMVFSRPDKRSSVLLLLLVLDQLSAADSRSERVSQRQGSQLQRRI